MNEEKEVKKIEGKQTAVDQAIKMVEEANEKVDLTLRYWGSKWSKEEIDEELGFGKFKKIAEKRIKNQGVKIRVVGGFPDEEMKENVISLIDIGAELRILERQEDVRFVLKDNVELLLVTSERYASDLHYYYSLKITTPELVNFFSDHFNNLWTKARVVDESEIRRG